MNVNMLRNRKNTTILTAKEMNLIRHRASPIDYEETMERDTKRITRHENLQNVTSNWKNTINGIRQDRLTRLQKEKDQHEKELQIIDQQEEQRRKKERKDQIARAEDMRFQEKAEVRAVNSKLLLHEVYRQRHKQMLIKERQKRINQEKEEAYAREEKRKFEEAEAHERELARQRREKAKQVAEGFRMQRQEAEDRKRRERKEEIEEEYILARENKRLLAQEQKEIEARKQHAQRLYEESMKQNESLLSFKNQQQKLDELEEEKLRKQKIALDEEMDRRQAEERRKRQEKQDHLDRLIERQCQELAKVKAQQQEFDDKQYELQWEKDKKEVENLKSKQIQFYEERRKDYLDAKARIEERKKRSKIKTTFPLSDAERQAEDELTQLDKKKMDNLKQLAEFQRQQAREKREREEAEREKEKLEYQRQVQLEQEQLIEAQEYAKEMLIKAGRRRIK